MIQTPSSTLQTPSNTLLTSQGNDVSTEKH